MSDAATPGPGAPARVVVEEHRALAGSARGVLDYVDGLRVWILGLDAANRDAKVRAELSGISVERLAELTDRNLRLRLLREADYRTAADLLDATATDLDQIPGVGVQTARGAIAAVDQLAQVIGATKRLRIEFDPVTRLATAQTGELLRVLYRLKRVGPLVEPHRTNLHDYAVSVAEQLPAAELATHPVRFALRRPRTKDAARAALDRLMQWDPWLESTQLYRVVGRLAVACAEPDPSLPVLWDDFEQHSVAYYALLEQIIPVGEEGALAAHGMLTADLADQVSQCTLDQSLLRAELRGYQAFGARFILNQGRVLLGDEMGLGKTVQAIAAMADRAAAGERHFLVVCPASVLVNWLREIATHSTLTPHRLHGDRRDEAMERWLVDGGVGVTTFDGLTHVQPPDEVTGLPSRGGSSCAPSPDGPRPGMLVVDEAHYVKNPQAQRTVMVAGWAAATRRVLFMTGTPMENRLEEFVALIRMLQPDIAANMPRHLGLTGADVFRRAVAPVYLRRNQVDVLVELPDLVSVDEWEQLTPAGDLVYRAAVSSGNFMAMRRAAYATPDPRDSSKLERLLEIVDDAAQNGHRVVVYSQFRDVIATVVRAIRESRGGEAGGVADGGVGGGGVAGGGVAARGGVCEPITGSVSPDERQAIIDAFSEAAPGTVLVCQIQAGGVGLNIQAASVVILCEPQLTPATEEQAIARVHRMGQVHTVRVHRLLVEDGVDERIVQILTEKRHLFDEYVRTSSLAETTVRAVDVTQSQLARRVVALEQTRLGYGPFWDELTVGSQSINDD